MLDFLQISTRTSKRGLFEIYPKFIVRKSNDLMIRGGDFYAIWIEERGEWSTDEDDALQIIDKYLDEEYEKYKKSNSNGDIIRVLHMWDSENRMIASWHRYCREDMQDNFHELDGKIIFANEKHNKRDYSSKTLGYSLQQGPIDSYDRLMSVLYSPEERRKIEWAIGSIVTGDSKKIQKFLVLYGSSGTGKSTVLNIIQQLFDGYYSTFDAKALGSSSNSFALEAFKDNPLVAIQHDGDLSRIEDNTRLNSLSSHELMTVNEKFKSAYTTKFRSFLFMGTNRPVKITDAKSGLIRRLIDVTPTGEKVPGKEYKEIMNQIKFELGGIAWHCRQVYLDDPGFYDTYIPLNMLGASNDFYNFVQDSYFTFESENCVSLKVAWEMYNNYCDTARVQYPYPQRQFKEELKNYFENFEERGMLADGTRVRSYYTGFKKDIFSYPVKRDENSDDKEPSSWIDLKEQESLLDKEFSECPAQYAKEDGTPEQRWSNVRTTLKDIDTRKVHYISGIPEEHIFIDFDLKDENGEKSRELNLKAASMWPVTYAELSKGEAGIHLHYIYEGDTSKLDPIYAPGIEVKVQKGNSALRRKLTLCTNNPIAHLNSGLPFKEEVKKILNAKKISSEKGLRKQIEKNLRKEVMGYTKPSVEFIKKILDDAYNDGLRYDVTDMEDALIEFAMGSTHNAVFCVNLVHQMKLKSEPIMPEPVEDIKDDRIVFFDCEVFPNLFLINWKFEGAENPVVRMINPTSDEVQMLTEHKLVGFNCRRYDNHILYARIIGENNEQLYKRSQAIISGDRSAFFGDAYNLSYTDIYDFSSKKQSLKKFEIELAKEHDERMAKIHKLIKDGKDLNYISKETGYDLDLIKKWLDDEEKNVNVVQHKELGLPWDQPVPEDKWIEVAEYCDADVIATEAVWNARHSDFIAREILAALAGMSVNDTTNSLTTKIIFEGNRKPQDQFNYRNMGVQSNKDIVIDGFDKYTCFVDGRPVFPGYIYDHGKSTYREEEVGEGGYVYSEPGTYGNIALLDIASMHPSSIVAERLFGKYTDNFHDILQARIAIKHKDFDKARTMLNGKLAPFLKDEKDAKALAQALKIAINSVYGLTSASFDNPFRDTRNKDNIVAKRGALFMINLKHEVQKRGFTVAHIKTDSIKIPDATPEIISFVMDYGKMYGYTFEHEDTYERMCLVNDAVYIAKGGDGHWTATGTQFQVPYVFKSLFSHEDIIFDDLCETKSVSGDSAIYLDMNEGLTDVTELEKEREKLAKKMEKELVRDGSEMLEDLDQAIAEGHNYIFVGRVGRFSPVIEGAGGGILYRKKDDKYFAVTGTKGFRWMESAMVKTLGIEDKIDYRYYEEMVDEAVQTIRKYSVIEDERHGVQDWFFTDIPYKKCTYTHGIPDRYYLLTENEEENK